jgi:hypothetical protein
VVGNRTQLTSTLVPVPAGLWNYDANDRFTAGDTYDANGNTVSSGGIANVGACPERSRGNFENHLVQEGGITIVYDGDGNRVSKTVGGVTTTHLVDDVNTTGYAPLSGQWSWRKRKRSSGWAERDPLGTRLRIRHCG